MATKFYSIDSYLQATDEVRERAFYHYLISMGYTLNTSVAYAKFCSTDDTLKQLVKNMDGKNSLLDIVDEYTISKIYVKAGPKKAAVGRYREFILDILRRTHWCYSLPCKSEKILYACIETLNSNSFTKNDLLRFIPLFSTLYTDGHNEESVITDAIKTLIDEEKIVHTGPDCYRLK